MSLLKETCDKNIAFFGKSYADLAKKVGKKEDTLLKSLEDETIKFSDLKVIAKELSFSAAQMAYIFR